MEEPQAMQIDGEKQGDEFYEEIEAPKFVDFTAPDQYRPDDSYWFCLRVGCDQKHEEEINSEAIYKDFVLRVMAARSPNIRLRKALNRKAASGNVKCPLTAPPKSSKSRIPRLALISSISQKVVHKPSAATPDSKKKQPSDVSKAFTTPRNRKRLSNPNTFRSVRNPKATTIAVPKNRAAKALVFNSPKKAVKTKTCSELTNTPVRTICAAMKKLEITSGKKHVLGYDKSLPIGGASRKQLRGREVKSRVYDALNSRSRNVHEPKSSRCLKRKNNGKDRKIKPSCDQVPHEGDDDSSDMEIDDKSRNGSFEGCSDECLETVKSQQGEHSVEAFSDASRGDVISLSSSEERDSGENEAPKSQAPSSVAEGTSEGSSSGKEKIPEVKESDDKENTLACDDTENDSGAIDNDEKENALASDDNRVQNHNDGKHGNIILGKKESSKISKKVNEVLGKTLKEGSIPAATGAQGVKYRKPKPTNPKPFRLRTDERRILKEANLEKKLLAPLKEITAGPRLQGGNSQRKHLNASQKNERCRRKSENECDMHEGGEKKLDRTTLDRTTPENKSIRTGSTCLKHSKGEVERKLSPMTPCRRTISSTHQKPNLVTSPMERDKAALKLHNSLKKIKSPIIQQKLVRPSGVMSSRKETVSLMTPCHLSVIKETSSKNYLTPNKVAKNGAPGSKASTRTASRSLSRGRRPATIPKEPTFHSIHVPKSCTRKQA